MSSSHSSKPIRAKIDKLGNLTREELAKQWEKVFKQPPPKAVKRGLLERGIAYHIQARRLGRLKPETRRTLLAIATGEKNDVCAKLCSSHRPNLKPGTRLVREWHGKPYQVNVTENGFEWDGAEYSSLLAIAKAITGTKWSGPRFFGL